MFTVARITWNRNNKVSHKKRTKNGNEDLELMRAFASMLLQFVRSSVSRTNTKRTILLNQVKGDDEAAN